VDAELHAADVAASDVEGTKNERGALGVDGVAHQRVDDFHERHLDGLLVLDEGDGVQARLRWSSDAADHALVEVAELLSAHGGRGATNSGDLDVGAAANVWLS
jgi:hypothetical protein